MHFIWRLTHIHCILQVQEEAKAAQIKAEARYRRIHGRVEKRDSEIARLRSVWRTLLVAHPDLDVAQVPCALP